MRRLQIIGHDLAVGSRKARLGGIAASGGGGARHHTCQLPAGQIVIDGRRPRGLPRVSFLQALGTPTLSIEVRMSLTSNRFPRRVGGAIGRAVAHLGAANIESRCMGTTMQHDICGSAICRLPEAFVASYESEDRYPRA